jgi:hypothetical protein
MITLSGGVIRGKGECANCPPAAGAAMEFAPPHGTETLMILSACLCVFLTVVLLMACRRQVGSALWGLRLRFWGVPALAHAPARPATCPRRRGR